MPMIFFYFLKIIFDISTSKRSKTYKPYLILVKKKIKFFGNAAVAAFPNVPYKWSFSVQFLSKKNNQTELKKTETGSNRPVSVRIGFLGQKPVQTGLARVFSGFF